MANSTPESDEIAGAPPPAGATGRDTPIGEQVAEIADAVAELQAARVAEDVAARTARRQLRPFELVMVALLAVSLLVHALTLARLFSVRSTLRDEVERLAQSVRAAKSSTVSYNLPIDQRVPLNVDVPIERSLQMPINTQVQIKQTITLPVDTALGRIDVPVPIDASIPISTTVPIEFNQTVNISTTVPIRLDVPIQVDLGSPQIAGYLDRLYQALLELRDRL
ncbi:MAG TPA: hypothetical protein VF897_26350 [Roseiflexaceae bacterium]